MSVETSRLPDLPGLRLLADVARLGSIGAAGRAAGISQQSASERLRAMEALTGLPLVRRTPRGSEVTPAGRLLVEWSADLLERADRLEDALRSLREERSRALHVHASMTVAEHLLPGWLVVLRRERSVVATLTATNSEAVADAVRSGDADLGFVEGPADLAGLRSRTVARDELVLVAALDDPWARRRSLLVPAEVAARPLTSRERGSGTRAAWEQALVSAGAAPVEPEAELTTNTAVLATVAAGGAPAFLSRYAAGDLTAYGLVAVGTTGLDLGRDLRAVWAGGPQPPAGPVRDLVGVAGRR